MPLATIEAYVGINPLLRTTDGILTTYVETLAYRKSSKNLIDRGKPRCGRQCSRVDGFRHNDLVGDDHSLGCGRVDSGSHQSSQ